MGVRLAAGRGSDELGHMTSNEGPTLSICFFFSLPGYPAPALRSSPA